MSDKEAATVEAAVNWGKAFSTPAGHMLGFDTVERTVDDCHMLCRPVAPALDAAGGRIHSGAATVLADQCMGSAASGERPRALVTLDMRIDWFADAAPGSSVHCRARTAAKTGRTVFVTSDITDSADGRLLGKGAGEFMVGKAAGGYKDVYSRDASLQKHRAGLSFVGIDSFDDYLAMERSAGSFRLGPAHRFIGSPFLPALHGGLTAAALCEAMRQSAVGWRPAGDFHMLGWTTQFLLAGHALKPLSIGVEWIRRGKNVALLTARAYQDDEGRPVALAQGSFIARDADAAGPA